MNLNCINKAPFAMGGLSVKKKEEMPLRETECSPAKTIDFTLLVLSLSLRTLM